MSRLDQPLPDPPYHVLELAKKKKLVYIVSAAAIFSPLSSNIYFPAVGKISNELNISLSLVGLTITIYMVVQGIAPSIWGPFSDTSGRRPVFMGTFLIYLVANVGLGLSNNFSSLMVFRGLQAAGSAATISIGAGVIGDITTPKERGGLIGIFGGLRMMGQSIGPVLGGMITQYFGFHAIFWFLAILGTMSLVSIITFLPETLRSIAGNGTIRLTVFQRPLVHSLTTQLDATIEQNNAPKPKVTIRSILAPLRFLFEKDVFITLLFGSIVYTVWSMMTSSTAVVLQAQFGLTELQVGLAFLPNGAGCMAGSYLTGYLMDYDYKLTEERYRKAKGITDAEIDRKVLSDFPIERSRLRSIWWVVLAFVTSTALYGFSFLLRSLAPPLVLQFCIAYTATAVFSFNSALIIDLYPEASASATAINNLMRCSVGAVGVAVVQTIIESIGVGFAFFALALFTAIASPLLVLEWVYGASWRAARIGRLADEAAKKKLDGGTGVEL